MPYRRHRWLSTLTVIFFALRYPFIDPTGRASAIEGGAAFGAGESRPALISRSGGVRRSAVRVIAGVSTVRPASQVTPRWPLAIAPNHECTTVIATAGYASWWNASRRR